MELAITGTTKHGSVGEFHFSISVVAGTHRGMLKCLPERNKGHQHMAPQSRVITLGWGICLITAFTTHPSHGQYQLSTEGHGMVNNDDSYNNRLTAEGDRAQRIYLLFIQITNHTVEIKDPHCRG